MSREMTKDEKKACQVVMDAVGFYVDNLNDDPDYGIEATHDEDNHVDSIAVEEYGDTGYYNEAGAPFVDIIHKYKVEIVVTKID